MARLSGLDASFLYLETPSQPLHVCALLVLDGSAMPGGYSFPKLADELTRRLKVMPAFRRKLHGVPLGVDHPVWVEDHDFDVDHHLHRVAVPAPGGRAELAELCGHIAGVPLDRARPLWEMWVIEGLAGGRIAVLAKLHHASLDGVAGANLLSHLCGLAPDAAPAVQSEPDNAAHPPHDLTLLLHGLGSLARKPFRLAKLLPDTLGILPRWIGRSLRGAGMPAPFTAPRTSFNGTITGHRAVAYSRLRLDDLKRVKNAFGTTVNDVVLAMCAGALRRYLSDRDELPDSPLIAIVPVSHHGELTEGVNRLSGLFTSLATDVDDPVERLRAIAAGNTVAKEHHRAIGAGMLADWAAFAAPTTFGLAARVYAALRLAERHPVVHNLVISNVLGPPMPIYFLGCRVSGMYPLGPVFHGAGLNITVLSNDGHVDVGLIACRELAPDLWALADALPEALQELMGAAAWTSR